LELVVGIPLAIVTAQQLGRFSLFALAPIASFILLVIFLWPKLWALFTETPKEEPEAEPIVQPA